MQKITKSTITFTLILYYIWQLMKFFEDYFKILSTKNAEWSFQKEWRIIGKPCTKLTIPKIKKIYLGKNIKSENKDFILSLANELDFEVYMQEDDYENLTFRYVKIRG